MPAEMPMINAPVGLTKPDAGVIATRPATAPEIMPSTDGFLATSHSENIQLSETAAVAIFVAAAALTAIPVTGTAEPASKPDPPVTPQNPPITPCPTDI